MRLIEGGQEVAALDRINQLLKKTPNAAWLLALKGELTLGMREIDSFRETANRFLKLKPDNPLALIMQSIVCAIEAQPLENASRYLLEGMAESRESLPALALPAIQMLIRSLEHMGRLSMVGYWADVYAALTGQQGPQEDSVLLDPHLNLIAKAPTMLIEDPPGAPWKERLAEVLVLSRAFRYDQAEKKLQSILRDFPGQPGPLSHLLRAQYAQLEQGQAMATARKLSEHKDITPADRAYYAAVAYELEPDHASLQTTVRVRYCEIDSEERVANLLAAIDYISVVDSDGVDPSQYFYASMVGDEVPARRVYHIYDCALPTAEATVADEDLIISLSGTVALFSKQTDRPARALLIANDFPANRQRIDELVEALQLGAPASETDPPVFIEYTEFLNRDRTLVAKPPHAPSVEQFGRKLTEEFLATPLAALDNKSPLEAVADERNRATVLGLLSHLEGEQGLIVTADAIDTIYKRLELERPRVEVNPEAQLKLLNVLDLERVDPKQASPPQLKGLMLRAMALGASRVCFRLSHAIIECEGLAEDQQMQIIALSNLLTLEPSLEKNLQVGYQLEAKLSESNLPVGRILLQRMSTLHALNRTEEAQAMIIESIRKYPEDPYLMSFLQYATQEQGQGMAPDTSDQLASRMMQNSARSATSDSGLVLPGQEPGGSSESKLWLPGS